MDRIFEETISSEEEVSLGELSDRIQEKEGVMFRSRTLRRMIHEFRARNGSYPLIGVGRDVFRRDPEYYR